MHDLDVRLGRCGLDLVGRIRELHRPNPMRMRFAGGTHSNPGSASPVSLAILMTACSSSPLAMIAVRVLFQAIHLPLYSFGTAGGVLVFRFIANRPRIWAPF